MKIYLGADHGGFELKEQLKNWLLDQNYQVIDCGAEVLDQSDDYPEFTFQVAEAVAKSADDRGILLCRSGGGMVIAANKIKSIRAVEVRSIDEAKHAREHNDANIMGLAGDKLSLQSAQEIVTAFLTTPFSQDERHLRRLRQISQKESMA